MSQTTNDKLHAEAMAVFASMQPNQKELAANETQAQYNERRKAATAKVKPILAEMDERMKAGETFGGCGSMKAYCSTYKKDGCLTYARCRQILTDTSGNEGRVKSVRSLDLANLVGKVAHYKGSSDYDVLAVEIRGSRITGEETSFIVRVKLHDEKQKPATEIPEEKSALAGEIERSQFAKRDTVHLIVPAPDDGYPDDSPFHSTLKIQIACMRYGRPSLHHTTTNRELVTCKKCLGTTAESEPEKKSEPALVTANPKTVHFNKFGRLACKQTDGWAARRRTSTKVETEVTCKSCLREIVREKRDEELDQIENEGISEPAQALAATMRDVCPDEKEEAL